MNNKYYKHPQFGMVFGEDIKTPIGRVSWPSLVTPKAPPPPKPGEEPGKPRYEITLILGKDNDDVKSFMTAVEAMANEMLPLFNEGKKAQLSGLLTAADGDKFDTEKYNYYKNSWIIAARNANPPKIVNAGLVGMEPNQIYGGQECILVVQPLITAHGLSYKLKVVQLVKDDGTRYGGSARDGTDLLSAIQLDGAIEVEPPAVSKPKGGKGKDAMVNLLA